MNPISRAISVLTAPGPAMSRAAGEPATTTGLVTGYAAIIGALPALTGLLLTIISLGSLIRHAIVSTILTTVAYYVLRDIGVTIVIGLLLAALAPNFGGRKDNVAAMKLAVYAATPIWIAAALMALITWLLPTLGGLAYIILLLGFAYAGYILYLGAGPLLGVPKEQAAIVGGAGALAWLVLYFIVEQIIMRVAIGAATGGAVVIVS